VRDHRATSGSQKDAKHMTCHSLAGILLITLISGCTSDPYAPINQTTPIRQMDNAFEGRPVNAPPPGYRYQHDRDYDADGPQTYSHY
jgi:hypothetical protein